MKPCSATRLQLSKPTSISKKFSNRARTLLLYFCPQVRWEITNGFITKAETQTNKFSWTFICSHAPMNVHLLVHEFANFI